MTEENFWALMAETNAKSDADPEEQQILLERALINVSTNNLVKFDNIYQKYINKAYTWPLWGAAYLINGGCSDDCFMDFRGWLIAQGQDVYNKALENPDSLAELEHLQEDMEWEGFGYIAFTIYEEKMGMTMPVEGNEPHPPEPSGDRWEEENLGNLFPALNARFGFI